MKKFTKGKIVSIVEDDDRRISEYVANGWKEEPLSSNPVSIEDEILGKSIADAAATETEGGGKVGRRAASNRKTNDTIKANVAAAAESEEVDDGLIKKPAADAAATETEGD